MTSPLLAGLLFGVCGGLIVIFANRLTPILSDVLDLRRTQLRFVATQDEPVLTWATSKERREYQDKSPILLVRAVGASITTFGGCLVLASRLAASYEFDPIDVVGLLIVNSGLLGLVAAALPYIGARSAYRARVAATAAARVDQAITQACDGSWDVDLDPDSSPSQGGPSAGAAGGRALQLPQLYQLNRRQLDEYQRITQRQQRSAFHLAQMASVIAFLVLVGGVGIALSAEDNMDKYLSSGLTALGSLLSSFLAATFFRSYRDANRQLNRYYLEPQRTGRLLSAERLTADAVLGTQADRQNMIAAVLSWEMPLDSETKKDASQTKTAP